MAIFRCSVPSGFFNDGMNALKYWQEVFKDDKDYKIKKAFQDALMWSYVDKYDLDPEDEDGTPETVYLRLGESYWATFLACYYYGAELAKQYGFEDDYAVQLVEKRKKYIQEKKDKHQHDLELIRTKYPEFLKTGYNGKFTKKAFAEMIDVSYPKVCKVLQGMEKEKVLNQDLA